MGNTFFDLGALLNTEEDGYNRPLNKPHFILTIDSKIVEWENGVIDKLRELKNSPKYLDDKSNSFLVFDDGSLLEEHANPRVKNINALGLFSDQLYAWNSQARSLDQDLGITMNSTLSNFVKIYSTLRFLKNGEHDFYYIHFSDAGRGHIG
jgi:hypothetical protein